MLRVRTDVAQALKTTCEAVSRASVSTSLISNEKTPCSTATGLQAVAALQFDDPLATMLHGIIVRHMLIAESVDPGCHSRFIQSLLKALSRNVGGNTPLASSGDTEGVQVTRMSFSATTDDLRRTVARHIDQRHIDIVNDAVALAGSMGKIIIERSASLRCSIELIDGYTFNNVTFVWNGSRFEAPLVVCIDGFIESVAEVNRFLTEIAESRDRCLMFVRGMADEVKHTLRTNYHAGRLGVFPIVVPFELEGINTLNDVSIVSGCELVTSIKGDLISNVGLRNASRVSSATCSRSSVMIVNNATKRSVEQHSHTLSEHIRKGDANVAKMLESRLRSLVPRTVVIRLPNDDSFVRTAQMIDNALRAIKVLVRYGVVGSDREPAASCIAIETSVSQCVLDITNIGAALVTC